jgi:hypothetical protein
MLKNSIAGNCHELFLSTSMGHLVLRHPSYMRGTTYPFSLSVFLDTVLLTTSKM